jgi:phospholipid/cholesterol/gamma-HCH transport system substrate-binding protein
MKNTLETRLGLFVALAVLALAIILEMVGGIELFRPGYHVYALFKTAQELKEGDRVKMAGVAIGRVEHIRLDETNNKVRVSMKVRKNTVKTDSVATIKFQGLLGQNFVSVDFGTPGSDYVKDDQLIGSQEQPDLSSMMQKLDDVASNVQDLTKSFTGVKIDKLVGPLIDIVEANKAPITATFSNLQSLTHDLSTQIAEGKGTVGKLVKDEALYNSALAAVTNLQGTAVEVRQTVADARKIVDQVNSGQGTVGKLLKDEALYRETTASMTSLKEILQKINQGTGTVGKLINDQEFYKNAKMSLQKLDKATEGLEDQGPLSVMGILVNYLF